MSEFRDQLRQGVVAAQRAVTTAWKTGNDDHARWHAGHVADLLEIAIRHGIDTSGWVDPAVRSFVDRCTDHDGGPVAPRSDPGPVIGLPSTREPNR